MIVNQHFNSCQKCEGLFCGIAEAAGIQRYIKIDMYKHSNYCKKKSTGIYYLTISEVTPENLIEKYLYL